METTININDYISQDEMRDIAVDTFRNLCISKLNAESEMQRILSNQAYAIVGKLIDEKYNRNMEEYLTEKCDKLLSDESAIKYELFRDSSYGAKKGPALLALEELVKTKLRDKLEKTAEKVVAEISLNTKKFAKMVAQETAKIVAERALK